jgi:hypothetical protein
MRHCCTVYPLFRLSIRFQAIDKDRALNADSQIESQKRGKRPMKRLKTKASQTVALILFSTVFWSANAYGVTPEQIFVWVSRQMEIEYVYNVPAIQYISKNKLQNIFQEVNQESFRHWRMEYGQAKADSIMATYQNRLVGLFNPETQTIYVGNFLLPCRQNAVLVHEMTHFFQHWIYGSIQNGSFSAEDQHIFREIQAYQMEARFTALFCKSTVRSELILAFIYYP